MREFVLDRFLETSASYLKESDEDPVDSFPIPGDRLDKILDYVKSTGIRISIRDLQGLDLEDLDSLILEDLTEEERMIIKELAELSACQVGSAPAQIKIKNMGVCRITPDFKYYTLIEDEAEDEDYIVFFFNDPRVLQCIDFEV